MSTIAQIGEISRAQESRLAIEKLYIGMRHLFNRGFYKPSGDSGRALREALLTLRPEIYGSLGDPNQVELEGLVYVIDRLPIGITECRYIKLISEEGYYASNFEVLIPAKRRRKCYRVDQEQMLIEVTRGKSEIYDIITHLTFLYIEADKIKNYAFDTRGNPTNDWVKLEAIVQGKKIIQENNKEAAFTYLSSLLGRTFEETNNAHDRLKINKNRNNGLFHIVYWLGKIAWEEEFQQMDRVVSFTPTLRQRNGQHIYGERWSNNIKKCLLKNELHKRPMHIISANMHSVVNSFFAAAALEGDFEKDAPLHQIAIELSKAKNEHLNIKTENYAQENGMTMLRDSSGTNISVQIFDTARFNWERMHPAIKYNKPYVTKEKPIIIVMDYAFGEQAYETTDELLKPYEEEGDSFYMNVTSISVMGKAGILTGKKGDIMIPTSHIFEGSADNYPIENALSAEDFKGCGLGVYTGSMISVLGTSLQNRDVLSYFKNSSWNTIGLEMEGAHYQKAIQAQSKVRNNINKGVKLMYAYYASDNPLISGNTLASGSLGIVGVKPTYVITLKLLEKILKPD